MLILELLWNVPGFSLSTPVPGQGGVDGAPKSLQRELSGSRRPTARSHSCWSHQWVAPGKCHSAVTAGSGLGDFVLFFPLQCWFSSFFSGTMGASSLPSFLISTPCWGCWGVRVPWLGGTRLGGAGPTQSVSDGPWWHLGYSPCPLLGAGDGRAAVDAFSLGNTIQPQQLLDKGRGFAGGGFSGGLCTTGSFFH